VYFLGIPILPTVLWAPLSVSDDCVGAIIGSCPASTETTCRFGRWRSHLLLTAQHTFNSSFSPKDHVGMCLFSFFFPSKFSVEKRTKQSDFLPDYRPPPLLQLKRKNQKWRNQTA
jgi:hypothetical protein